MRRELVPVLLAEVIELLCAKNEAGDEAEYRRHDKLKHERKKKEIIKTGMEVAIELNQSDESNTYIHSFAIFLLPSLSASHLIVPAQRNAQRDHHVKRKEAQDERLRPIHSVDKALGRPDQVDLLRLADLFPDLLSDLKPDKPSIDRLIH